MLPYSLDSTSVFDLQTTIKTQMNDIAQADEPDLHVSLLKRTLAGAPNGNIVQNH